MKFSLYNTYLHPTACDTLIYNAFSGKFVAIRNNVIDGTEVNLNNAITSNHTLYQNLIQAGMIVNDNCNEVSLLKDRIQSYENNLEEFILQVNPTLDCNFKCWYCYEHHVKDSRMDIDTINNIEIFMSRVFKNNKLKNFQLSFFGGEPLIEFDSIAKKLIIKASSLCIDYGVNFNINFTSNGSLLTPNMIKFLSNHNCSFQITLDGGREEHNKTRYYKDGIGSYDKIIKNIKKLLNNGIQVIVRVNYTSENINSVETILNNFRDINPDTKKLLRVDFQRVWQDKKDRFDTTEDKIRRIRDLFSHRGFQISNNYIPQYVTNVCYGDKKNHILINYNGDVYGCTARDFNETNKIGALQHNGIVIYDAKKVELRENYKLSNESCKVCRIAPLCGGGCKQRAFEQRNSFECPIGYSSADKDDIVCDIFCYFAKI